MFEILQEKSCLFLKHRRKKKKKNLHNYRAFVNAAWKYLSSANFLFKKMTLL